MNLIVALAFLALFALPVDVVLADENISSILVLNDSGVGVKAKIIKIKKTEGEMVICNTDINGYCGTIDSNKLKTADYEILQVEPTSSAYYHCKGSWPKLLCLKEYKTNSTSDAPIIRDFLDNCKQQKVQPIIFQLTSRALIDKLEDRAKTTDAEGNFGDASMIYAEIAYRYQQFDQEKAKEFREKSAMAFAKHANVPPAGLFVIDPRRKTLAISPEYKETIEMYQKSKGLEPSGKLDYQTLRSSSTKPIGAYIAE